MYLERIEIQGFKSFANPVTLVFNRQLTAIVGPNGSGKSNIADAIRWVLGEQSLKLLRSKKSDDIIFAGSTTKGRLGFARVAIYLNNSDHQADIDYDQVAIERTIDRSGESEFKINGTKVRLTDIHLLLAKAHVGQKSYSVIGQGMIDSLLTLSAQERRDFFDEATGVKHYQIKKQQAIGKLDHTEENLVQAELVLQELIPRLRTLSRQVKRLERKEELETTLRNLHADYYGFLSAELERERLTLDGKRSQADSVVSKLERESSDIQHNLETHEKNAGRSAAYDALQKKLFAVQQEFNALMKKKIILEGQSGIERMKRGEGDQVILTQRLEELTARGNNLDRTLHELETEAQARKKEAAGLSSLLKEQEQRVSKLEEAINEAETAPAEDEIGRTADALFSEQSAVAQAINDASTLDDLAGLKTRVRSFGEKLSAFFTRLKRSFSKAPSALKEYTEQSRALEEVRGKMHDVTARLELTERQHELIQEQRAELDRDIRDLKRMLTDDGTARGSMLAKDVAALETDLAEKQKEVETARREIDAFNSAAEEQQQDLVNLQKRYRTLQYDLSIKQNELTSLKVELAKVETRAEDLAREISVEAPGVPLAQEAHINPAAVKTQIEETKRSLSIIGGIDEETITEYRDVKEKHDYLAQQTTDLRKAKDSLIELIKDLDQHIGKQFEAAFKNINNHFSKYFKKIFSGGSAKLILTMKTEEEKEDEEETADESTEDAEPPLKKIGKNLDYTIDIQATPPGKKLSSVTVLSGGEKALTSIALISAIIANSPPPFVVLDEVDAALDEANSIRFAEIVDELTAESQFITVTHNRATMHQAKILYGVTMNDDGVSSILSVNFEQADELSA